MENEYDVGHLEERLFELRDAGYADFLSKCVPTVEKERIIGIRTPVLKNFFKTMKKEEGAAAFLDCLPHRFHEENCLHASFLCDMKDFGSCLRECERFLPYIDNWAVCDGFPPKIFLKHRDEIVEKSKEWLRSDRTYTVRFGLNCLMAYLNGDGYESGQLALAASVCSEEYYVNMMQAWYFATALTYHYEDALPYVERRLLPEWTRRKTIQKAVESFRIADDRKAYLKSLR